MISELLALHWKKGDDGGNEGFELGDKNEFNMVRILFGYVGG